MIADVNGLNYIKDILTANRESIDIVLRLIDDGVIITDADGKVALINEVAETLTGWPAEEAVGRFLDEILISKDNKEYITINKGTPVYSKDGKTIGFVLILRDISEKRGIKKELNRAKKSKEPDLLTREIAHIFNNKLTVIMGNISLAKMQASHNDKIYEKLIEVEQASIEVNNLTRHLFGKISSR
jgi:signal transduction histidine kinase